MSDDTSVDDDADKTVVPTEPRPGFASIASSSDAPARPASLPPSLGGSLRTSTASGLRTSTASGLRTSTASGLRTSTASGGTGTIDTKVPTGVTGTGTIGHSESRLRTEANAVIANALAEEEGVRAHGFSSIIVVACTLVSVALPFLGGDAIARHLAQFGLLVILVASIYVFRRTREPRRYSMRLHRAYGFVIGTFVAFLEYYLGMFGPVPVVLTLGILFIGQSADRVGGIVIPVYVILRWFVVAGLVASGVILDRGLVSAASAEPSTRVFAMLAVAMILGFTVRMARVSRASLNEAMTKAQEAILLAHERDAQLEEAKQNLDRALRAVVGKQGRYSGWLAGPYRLDEIIGVGAMGEVYAAAGQANEGPVAVKLMQADSAERDDLVERFFREGEICRKLRSPHVVRVLEVGRMEDGSPFLAMERLYGDDLAGRLRRDGHIALEDAVELAQQMAAGLDEAHAAGIVHRDLKPQNLFLAEQGEGKAVWKILDFGVSKLAGTTGTLTRAEVVGTPGYMSPEQARGREVDHRSDLFSMGVVLYRAVTGQPAFNGPNVPEKLFEIVYRMPETPTKLRAELPPEIDLVLAIALAKDPAHRFESASALAKAFARAARRELPKNVRDRGQLCQQRMPWGTTASSAPTA